jgi:cyclin-dependent kinase 12/13
MHLLSRLKHKNVVDLLEIVTSKGWRAFYPVATSRNHNLGNVYLVFEYMEHDLLGLIDKKISLEPMHIKCILKQLLEGVEFLHTKNVIHRDIKCANILMNNAGDVKLADFGLARVMDKKKLNYTNKVVTLWYRSPELLLGSVKYTTAVDMWSVGCCFGELLTSAALFRADTEGKLLEIIYSKCGSPSEETWPGVSSLAYYPAYKPSKQYQRQLCDELKSNPKYLAPSSVEPMRWP